jgi:hypothetical protein
MIFALLPFKEMFFQQEISKYNDRAIAISMRTVTNTMACSNCYACVLIRLPKSCVGAGQLTNDSHRSGKGFELMRCPRI